MDEEILSSELKATDLRRQSMRRTLKQLSDSASSFLIFTLQWKEVEDHLDFTSNAVEQRARELRSVQESRFEELQRKEKELASVQESVEARVRAADAKEESVCQREKELAKGEEQFEVKRKEEDEVRKREIEKSVKNSIMEKVESDKGKLAEQIKEVELREKQIEERSKKVEAEIAERYKEIELKEKRTEEKMKEVALKEMKVEERMKEVEVENKKLVEQCEKIEVKKKRLEEQLRTFELENVKLVELELEKEAVIKKYAEIESKKESVELCWSQFKMESNKLLDRTKDFELKDKKFEERCREFELKERRLVDNGNVHVKMEPPDSCVVGSALPLDANLHLSLTMNGRALQIFFNEGHRHHGKLKDELLYALGQSADPAMLVLDAMEGYYHPHLKSGDKEFEDGVVKESCNLLLQQLMRLSPLIRPDVSKEAMKVALEWMSKMKKDSEHCKEIIGFLSLVGAYGLSSSFDTDELLSCLEIVARFDQAVELLSVLGVKDKISGFIKNLIRSKHHLAAVKFTCAFNLVNHLPPTPLLQNFLLRSKIEENKFTAGSLCAKIAATERRIAEARDVLKCFDKYSIQESSDLSRKSIMNLISGLEKKNESRKEMQPAIVSTSKRRKCCRVSAAAATNSTLSASSILKTPTPTSTASLAAQFAISPQSLTDTVNASSTLTISVSPTTVASSSQTPSTTAPITVTSFPPTAPPTPQITVTYPSPAAASAIPGPPYQRPSHVPLYQQPSHVPLYQQPSHKPPYQQSSHETLYQRPAGSYVNQSRLPYQQPGGFYEIGGLLPCQQSAVLLSTPGTPLPYFNTPAGRNSWAGYQPPH